METRGRKPDPSRAQKAVAMHAAYVRLGNIRAVGLEFGVTGQYVSYIFQQEGISLPPRKGRIRPTFIKEHPDKLPLLIQSFQDNFNVLHKAAKAVGVSAPVAKRALLAAGVFAELDYAGRFWSRVDKSGGAESCWPWMRGCHPTGYGVFSCPLWKHNYAHQAAYYFAHGESAINNVLHRCGVPQCCNPRHLYDGTQKENAADRNQHCEERGIPFSELTRQGALRRYARARIKNQLTSVPT